MAISPDDVADTVEKFIRARFRVPRKDPLFSRDVDLFDSGYVDSVGVIELISFLESTFKIKISEDSLFSDEFTTINGISRVVSACGGAASPGSSDGLEVPVAGHRE